MERPSVEEGAMAEDGIISRGFEKACNEEQQNVKSNPIGESVPLM